jgi:hypothetical protein
MTLPEPPKPANLTEEQRVIAQQATLPASFKTANILITLGIQKYRNLLIKL